MTNISGFRSYNYEDKINLHVCTNPKFKTNLLQIYIGQPLKNNEQAAATALLPAVLHRGCKKYPSKRKLNARLEEMYGSRMNVSVLKRGENQIIRFSLEIPNDKFINTEENLFEKGLDLLYQIIFNPVVKNNSFNPDFVNQEKQLLEEEIKSLINDKYSYAVERCFQEMCREEAFGIYKLGNISTLEKIDEYSLYQHYQKILAHSQFDLIVVGNMESELVKSKSARFLEKKAAAGHYNHTQVIKDVEQVREVIEEQEVTQGKLSLGFRTGITRKSPLYYSLLLYNGILGCFPHSKLFQNVREKASLAYYANSKLESTKGLLLITSGIQIENYQKAREIILAQVNKIARGEISDEEYIWTKKGIINQFKSAADNNKSLAGHYLLGLVNNSPESIESMIDKLEKTSKEKVIETAKQINLDTVYFLRNKESVK